MLEKSMNRKGFTMLELMATLVIISMIAAVAMPTYSHYIKKARVKSNLSAVSANGTAMMAHLAEYGDLDGIVVDSEGGKVTTDNGFTGAVLNVDGAISHAVYAARDNINPEVWWLKMEFDLITNLSCMVVMKLDPDLGVSHFWYTGPDDPTGDNTIGVETTQGYLLGS